MIIVIIILGFNKGFDVKHQVFLIRQIICISANLLLLSWQKEWRRAEGLIQ